MVKSAGKNKKRQYHGSKPRNNTKAKRPPLKQDFVDGISVTFDVAIVSAKTKRRDHVIRRENARFPMSESEALADYFWENCHQRHLSDF